MAPRHNFRFKNPLYSLDTSIIGLCLSVFLWANFRSTKNAIKLHVGLSHSSYLLEFVTITEGKTSDVEIGRTLQFPQDSIVAVDRGYNDYSWYNCLTERKISFITRLKVNTKFKVISRKPVLKNKGLTSDQIIKFTALRSTKEYPIQLRRIGFRDKETGKH